jgi:hypothetical protein
MGGVCSHSKYVHDDEDGTNEVEHTEPDSRAKAKAVTNPAEVIALIVYVDYGFEPAKSAGWCPSGFGPKLDTGHNANMITMLLTGAGVTKIYQLGNTEATKEQVLMDIHEIGEEADENDTFFFFYSGHGASMADQDGDEDDGMDEALCLPSKDGRCDQSTWLRDDDFAAAVHAVSAGNKLIIMDCCHSGTMLDFDKPMWQGQPAISITGCRDAQESASTVGIGELGGSFSKCLYHAATDLGNKDATVAEVFNLLVGYRNKFVPPGHQQDIQLMCAPGMMPNSMMWPLKQIGDQSHGEFGQVGSCTYGVPEGV